MAKWGGFVILADMRTGSNALEERLNDFEGLESFGEVFNPNFVGKPGNEELAGLTIKARDASPLEMIAALRRKASGLAGFRLFSDHDPRVLDHVLSDRQTAKIVLTRSVLDSYVSLKIARATGQWWLGDLKRAKQGTARFDGAEFEEFAARRAVYLAGIRHRLQETGQTAFEVRYEDIGDAEVITGLARFLGAGDAGGNGAKGRRQNPVPLSERVSNFAEMKAHLAARDPFDLDAAPEAEEVRGPNVPSFVAVRAAPILFMPVKCAADLQVRTWLAALGGGAEEALEHGFSQKALRKWKREAGRHVSFTVVAHPLERAHDAFCRFILATGQGTFTGIRDVLRRSYDVPLPDDPGDVGYDARAHAGAFLMFLKFVKGNLSGQTSIRQDGAWASQTAVLQGMAQFGVPDAVLRAERLAEDLVSIADRVGAEAPGLPEPPATRYALADIYSDRLERAARLAYQKDYMMFGYGPWPEHS